MKTAAIAATFVLLPALGTVSAAAQGRASGQQACVLDKGIYTCSHHAFAAELRSARNIYMVPAPHDGASDEALKDLAHRLAKRVDGPDSDLTFMIVKTDRTIYIGPSDTELATLRIYGRPSQNAATADGEQVPRGPVLWVESYRGQPDIPWPAVTHNLVEQFEQDFHIAK